MSNILKNLNKQQQKAVLYNEGPLSIIAGAGSGKTRTLTTKIAYLINELKVKPWRILALTFTNKAANEMKERIISMVGEKAGDIYMSTYHSLCARILREEIEVLGYSRNFSIIDPVDQRQILRPGYKKLKLNSRTLDYRVTLDFISKSKNANISPEEAIDNAKRDVDKALANLYAFYEESTKKSNSLDFDDLIIKVNILLKTDAKVAAKWAKKFDFVLVDEFQDTSISQYEIVNNLAKNSVMTVVGDPDQTIYTWRNADPKLIVDFEKNHKGAKTILLEQNYRSTNVILNAANKLISYNKKRIPKKLFTDIKSDDEISYYHGFSEDSEARWVVSEIEQLRKQGTQLKNIAILYRSNYLSAPMEKALINKNINYFIFGGTKFYQREEIKDVVAFLKIIATGDEVSLKRMINVPVRKIGATSQEALFNYLDQFDQPLFEAMIDNFGTLPLKKIAHENLRDFVNLIRKYRLALKNHSIAIVIDKFLTEIKYNSKWPSFEDEGRIDNIKELILSIQKWESKHPEGELIDFLNEISLYTDNSNTPLSNDYVTLMTIHSSKGLEFENLFVFELSEIVFPSKRALQENYSDSLEEERRLAYVAITRAKKKLFISSSRGYAIDYSSQKRPSRFVKEMGLDPQEFTTEYIAPKTFESNYVSNNNFVEGDKLIHEVFGQGVVVKLDGSVIQIAFKKPHGIKSLMKNHKSLRRVE